MLYEIPYLSFKGFTALTGVFAVALGNTLRLKPVREKSVNWRSILGRSVYLYKLDCVVAGKLVWVQVLLSDNNALGFLSYSVSTK